MKTKYSRSITELEQYACKWWPQEIVDLQNQENFIPLLLKTQDSFIGILTASNPNDSGKIFAMVENSNLQGGVFLKHLIVLADFGSEKLQRIGRDFSLHFPNNSLEYIINGQTYEYTFKSLSAQKHILTNTAMHTDKKHIFNESSLTNLQKDVAMILLYGANSVSSELARILEKCCIANLIGDKVAIETFVKQRYILVSRITGGSQANDLGNAAQVYMQTYLQDKLGESYKISSNGHIPGVTQNDKTPTTFDLVIEHNNKYIGAEISFQVTTNSTIERKAGQAISRLKSVHSTGNYVAYIIDGAGNFQRQSAVSTICNNSDCTIAYTKEEFEVLLKFIKEKLG